MNNAATAHDFFYGSDDGEWMDEATIREWQIGAGSFDYDFARLCDDALEGVTEALDEVSRLIREMMADMAAMGDD